MQHSISLQADIRESSELHRNSNSLSTSLQQPTYILNSLISSFNSRLILQGYHFSHSSLIHILFKLQIPEKISAYLEIHNSYLATSIQHTACASLTSRREQSN